MPRLQDRRHGTRPAYTEEVTRTQVIHARRLPSNAKEAHRLATNNQIYYVKEHIRYVNIILYHEKINDFLNKLRKKYYTQPIVGK